MFINDYTRVYSLNFFVMFLFGIIKMKTQNILLLILIALVAFVIYRVAKIYYFAKKFVASTSERYYATTSPRSGRTMSPQRGRTAGNRVMASRGGRKAAPTVAMTQPTVEIPATVQAAVIESTPSAAVVAMTKEVVTKAPETPTTTSMLVNALANAAKSENAADMYVVDEVMQAAMNDMKSPEGVDAIATLATLAVTPAPAPVEEVNKTAAVALSSQGSYCPANSPQPVGATPEWVNYCSELCMLNGTLNPALCPCACARNNPFIAYVN